MKKLRVVTKKEWLAFNKNGIGGIPVYGNEKQALKQARDIYGKGATIEFVKNTKVTIFKN